jgi:hypothetical protein
MEFGGNVLWVLPLFATCRECFNRQIESVNLICFFFLSNFF